MGSTRVAVAAALALGAVATLAVSPGLARAQDGGAPDDGAHLLELRLGQEVPLCSTGTLLCPARSVICDDTSIVAVVDSPRGIAFKGARVGSTLCSASGSNMARRVYRVRVIEPR